MRPASLALQAKAHLDDVGREVAPACRPRCTAGMGFTDLLGLHYWFKRIDPTASCSARLSAAATKQPSYRVGSRVDRAAWSLSQAGAAAWKPSCSGVRTARDPTAPT